MLLLYWLSLKKKEKKKKLIKKLNKTWVNGFSLHMSQYSVYDAKGHFSVRSFSLETLRVTCNVTALHNWSQYKRLVLFRTPPGNPLMTDLPSDLSSPLWNEFILNYSNLFYGLFKLSPHQRRIIPKSAEDTASSPRLWLWAEAEGGSSMS